MSGDLYFIHPYKTAVILKELGLSSKIIIAGLLHDVIEDSNTKEEIIKKEFGEEVCFLINGVTKLGKVRFQGTKRYVESLRKLFLATSEDIRVFIIKLADRLHNMRTLKYLPEEKRKRIATETLEVYAPIAHRLGIGKLKCELEDLSFKYLMPEEYEHTNSLLEEKCGRSIRSLKEIHEILQKRLEKEKIYGIEIDHRKKHLYSLYKKLQNKEHDIDGIYDVLALRIIVKNVDDCYKTLGIIHGLWKPLPRRIKDFIAFPKSNGYKSIHTTIFTGKGDIVEIQIRTREMHMEAEFGIAAHVTYKEKNKNSTKNVLLFEKLSSMARISREKEHEENSKVETPRWIKDLAEIDTTISSPHGFVKNLKENLLEKRIFIFTPNGDVIDLPIDSTILDFAYQIHSDIGDHATGAKINNKFVSLDTKLKNEDIVEIITNKNSRPTQKWLENVKTSVARRFIRQALQQKNSR